MKTNKIIYWISTGLMCLLFLFSAGMYFFQNSMIKETFTFLGFPTWIVYPLAVAKILAVIAILSKKSRVLKEWAYAGLFYDAVLAFFAHWFAGDGEFAPAIVAIVLILVSRTFESRVGFLRDDVLTKSIPYHLNS